MSNPAVRRPPFPPTLSPALPLGPTTAKVSWRGKCAHCEEITLSRCPYCPLNLCVNVACMDAHERICPAYLRARDPNTYVTKTVVTLQWAKAKRPTCKGSSRIAQPKKKPARRNGK